MRKASVLLAIASVIATSAIASDTKEVTIMSGSCINLGSVFDQKTVKIHERYGCRFEASDGKNGITVRYEGFKPFKAGQVISIPKDAQDRHFIKEDRP